jgi:autotransporter-associated beta strand protein
MTIMKRTIKLLSAFGCLTLGISLLHASDATWFGASGNWNNVYPTTPGWSNVDLTIPDGVGQLADISRNQTGIRDITLDNTVTVGRINLYSGGTGDTRVSNIKGTGTIILDNGASKPTITSATGNIGTNSVCVPLAGTNGLSAPRSGGKIVLAAANTYTGDTECYRRILGIRDANALPSVSNNGRTGNVILTTAGNPGDVANLHFQDLDAVTINGLSSNTNNPSSGTVPLIDAENAPSGTFTLTVGDGDQGGVYDGGMADAGSVFALTKIGNGTLTLNAMTAYSGKTTVNGGTLVANGAFTGGGAFEVNGGVLAGIGTIYGAVTVNAGGAISAGNSVGTLTLFNGLDLSAGGTNIWDLNANSASNPGVDYDQIVMNGGALDLSDSTLIVRLGGSVNTGDPFWSSSHTWTIISAPGLAGSTTNKYIQVVGGTPPGNFSTANDGSNVTLTFTPGAVPQQPKPVRITSIVGAGTGSVTVNYTNTIPGTNYTLQYRTNLSTAPWTTVGSKVAGSTTDSQTDGAAGSGQRYYRVFYFFTP